ncbi:hypothetical protein ZIOFF_073307 [Zingiber officinale]|uniref:Vesicle-fusing ATPase n=1 Tax=Zingiber officinale TaxID=94328 RepID=A0A8J5BVY5_ZINOF|nr:hypothetical protein ZIOFF_073307 [Zingiber officinale]
MAFRLNGIIDCGERHKHIHERALLLVEQIKDNQSPLVTYLLEGPTGSGKTSMAATIGIECDFPYVKMVSCDTIDERKIITQINVLARDERMEITSSMNGAPLFPPKKKSFSCIEKNGFPLLIVIASQD